ncbi:MAG: thiamine-binding protein [Bacteroidota bacterium]
MIDHNIHYSLQIVPKSGSKPTYDIVDEAIKVIQESGLRYQVTAMDTILEGPYDKILETAEKAQQACLDAGAEEMLVFIKMHYSPSRDVTFEEKNLDR